MIERGLKEKDPGSFGSADFARDDGWSASKGLLKSFPNRAKPASGATGSAKPVRGFAFQIRGEIDKDRRGRVRIDVPFGSQTFHSGENFWPTSR